MMKLYNNNTDLLNLFHVFVNNDTDIKCNTDEFIQYGLFFIDEFGNQLNEVDFSVATYCKSAFGLTNVDWSKSFHKSLEKVTETNIEILIAEQILHYLSTYGLESLGFKAIPFIPTEKILVDLNGKPSLKGFTVLTLVSNEKAIEYINNYLRITKSPNKMLIGYISNLMKYTKIHPDEINSYELKVIQYDNLKMVPTEGQDFLRYLVYKITNSTLLIKSHTLINTIKYYSRDRWRDQTIAYEAFSKANEDKLAEVFYRFKPLFLAFKSHEKCAPIINRIRRKAKLYHKPLSDVNVQNFYKLIIENRLVDVNKVLTNASNRQLIKLYNFLNCRENTEVGLEIYNIRNGSSYVNEIETIDENKKAIASCGKRLIIGEIIKRFGNTMTDKKFYIPSYINYAVPITEKQFTGFIPWGTKVKCPEDKAFSVGIYWNNYKNMRCDIDLHMSGINQSYGWNAGYTNGKEVIYSGDMTDATNGAAEAFYFKPEEDKFILSASNFTNYDEMPFQFLITEKNFNDSPRDYGTPPIDVADAMFAPINLAFKDTADLTLGLFTNHNFVFYGGKLSNNIVPRRDMYSKAIDSIDARISTMMSIEELLVMSGAKIYNDETIKEVEEEEMNEIIDLSPSALDVLTFINIIDQNEEA